jgi:ABC-type transport system involved in multi-copper enzyme maturation permease subunit
MVADTELQRLGTSGWRTGLANLWQKENRSWWALRRWLSRSILWAVAINGFVAFVMFYPGAAAALGMEPVQAGVNLLFQMGMLFLAIGAVVLAHGEILGERQLGVTEWLLSKPVSRSAYVLSKVLAHGLGVMVVFVGLQGAIAYGLLWLAVGEPFPPAPFLVGMAGLAASTLFYLTLTLMMGVLTTSRGVLLGVSMGVLMGGPTITNLLGKYAVLTPWSLGSLLGPAVMRVPLPVSIWTPIGVTATLAVVFVAVSLFRFEQLEF